MNTFKQGDIVICIDEKAAGDELSYLQRYVVEDYEEPFVVLEHVKGEWHETRFVLVDDVE